MRSAEDFVDNSDPIAPVRGFLHRPGNTADALVLTHGAGSNCESPLLKTLADAFCAAGLNVLRCDLPFRQLRPHGPPSPGSSARDQQGLSAAVQCMRREFRGNVFLGGHSYGGRQASMALAADPTLAAALLLLSYPLHPPRKPTELRTRHFPELRTPALFVHGTRDPFGTIAELEQARELIPATTELLSVPSAGHELISTRNRGELPQHIVNAFLRFLSSANRT